MSIQCILVVLYMYTLMCISSTDRVIAIAMIVVSVAIVLPVAGPVALITYIVLKKLDENGQPLNNNSYFPHAHLHVLYSVRAHGDMFFSFLEHMMYMM